MASLKHSLFCSIVFVLCSIILSTSPSRCQEPSSRLYIFGDSLFDAGNDLYRNPSTGVGKWPFGMSTPNNNTGRYSDGYQLPDYIALFAKLDVMPPSQKLGETFDQGANFAYAGAGVFESTEPAKNLPQQLASFMLLKDDLREEMGEMEAREAIKRSVFLFSLGGADYYRYNSNPNLSKDQKITYANYVVEKLTKALYDLYLEGGRKFAFQNVGPLGCTPGSRPSDTQCHQQLLDLANIHNSALQKALKKLQVELPGFSYSIFDYYTTLGDRANNPTKFGFKQGGVSACCGNGARRASNCGVNPYQLCDPKEYVFWDGGHTTQVANEQLATLFWSGGLDVVRPINLKKLFELTPIENSNLLIELEDDE